MDGSRSIAHKQPKQNDLISSASTKLVARGVVNSRDEKAVSLIKGIAVQRTMRAGLYNTEPKTISRPRRQAALIGAARLSKTWEELQKGSDTEDEEESLDRPDRRPETEEETEDTIVCKAISIGVNDTKRLDELTRKTPQDVFEDEDDDNDGDFEVDKEDIEDDDGDKTFDDDEISEVEEMKKKCRRGAGRRNNARKADIGRNGHRATVGEVEPNLQFDKHCYSETGILPPFPISQQSDRQTSAKGLALSDENGDPAFPPSPTISFPAKMIDNMNAQEAAQVIKESKIKGDDDLEQLKQDQSHRTSEEPIGGIKMFVAPALCLSEDDQPLLSQSRQHVTSQKRSSDSRSKPPRPARKKQRIGANGPGSSGLGGPSETRFRRKEIAAMLRSISKDVKWKDVAMDVGNPRRTASSYASHWKNVLIKNILERYPDDN